MKKTYFLSKITTFILCFILLAGTTTVFAAGKQLMSYNGTGISHYQKKPQLRLIIINH